MSKTPLDASIALSEYSNFLIQSLTKLDKGIFNDIVSFNIDCTNMPEFEHGGYRKSEALNEIITTLDGNDRNNDPAVYWFQIISDHNASDIYSTYKKFKEEIQRSVPAYKTNFGKWDSKTLYVGKAKSNIAGRMILHLGYEKRPVLQGLQLCHWKHIQNLKLELNIIYLPDDLDILAQVFELKLAKTLHPILGKHS